MTATSPSLETAPSATRRRLSGSPALWAAVLSRLLVVAAGVVGTVATSRVPGWQLFDPAEVSWRLGSVGRALAATMVRWDSIHYLFIAAHGYAVAGETVFFPLYPLLIAGLAAILGSYVVAGIVISAISFAAAMFLIHRLTELELGKAAADATVVLLAFAPLSLFLTAVYTESLFLALAVGAVYAARREHWKWSAVLTALAAVTRVPGVLVLVPVAWLWWRSASRRRLDAVLLAALPAAALLAFGGYLAARGYGWLAPINHQTSATHAHELTSGPPGTIDAAIGAAAAGIRDLLSGQPIYAPTDLGPFTIHFESVILLVVLLLAVTVLIVTFRRLPVMYGTFALLVLLLSISSPVSFQPLEGFDRYTLAMFPLWMGAGAWAASRRATWLLALVGGAALFFYSFEFATWTFLG